MMRTTSLLAPLTETTSHLFQWLSVTLWRGCAIMWYARTSSAAGLPWVQEGRYTSVGLLQGEGISEGTSLLGQRAVAWVEEKAHS